MATKQKTKLKRVKSFKDLPTGMYAIDSEDFVDAIIEIFPKYIKNSKYELRLNDSEFSVVGMKMLKIYRLSNAISLELGKVSQFFWSSMTCLSFNIKR